MLTALSTAVLCLSLSGASINAVPSAGNSTFPPCLVTCPLGDIHVVVIVRDLANNPVSGASVVLEFSGCPTAHLCDPLPGDPYTTDPVNRLVRMFADASGKVDFPLRVGGVCAAGTVRLFANGVLFANYALASPDQNGDGFVLVQFGVADPALFNPKLGTTDPTADFNCSGTVDAADTAIFHQHDNHTCNGIGDAVQRRTWGTLKQHYR